MLSNFYPLQSVELGPSLESTTSYKRFGMTTFQPCNRTDSAPEIHYYGKLSNAVSNGQEQFEGYNRDTRAWQEAVGQIKQNMHWGWPMCRLTTQIGHCGAPNQTISGECTSGLYKVVKALHENWCCSANKDLKHRYWFSYFLLAVLFSCFVHTLSIYVFL